MSDARRSGLTIIEILVILVVCVVLATLFLNSAGSGREPARRAQCVNNMKQLGLAAQNYHETHNVFPAGTTTQNLGGGRWGVGPSCFLGMTPFMEGVYIFNCYNQSFPPGDPSNGTAIGSELSTLWCPDDRDVSRRSDPNGGAHTSYRAVAGPWFSFAWPDDPAAYEAAKANSLGVVGFESRVAVSDIPDGTANTMLFGESAHSLLPADVRDSAHRWTYGFLGHTVLSAFYPINPRETIPGPAKSPRGTAIRLASASSLHNGAGANFAFGDGSVRFLKNTIDAWPLHSEDASPLGVMAESPWVYRERPDRGFRGRGVYQALSTRSGGETLLPGSW